MPLLTFYQTGWFLYVGYDVSYFLFLEDFFSFHISGQRKEAKEVRITVVEFSVIVN